MNNGCEWDKEIDDFVYIRRMVCCRVDKYHDYSFPIKNVPHPRPLPQTWYIKYRVRGKGGSGIRVLRQKWDIIHNRDHEPMNCSEQRTEKIEQKNRFKEPTKESCQSSLQGSNILTKGAKKLFQSFLGTYMQRASSVLLDIMCVQEAWIASAQGSERGFPCGAVVKNPPANVGDTRKVGSIPGSERSPGVGNGNPLQYSCLENPMDRGAWKTTVYGVAKNLIVEHAGTLEETTSSTIF